MCISITLLWLGLSITGYFRTNVPSVEFYKSWARYKKEMRELSEFYANRKNATTEANCYLDNFPKTFVIVIGESATKNHYGIYGYKRNTTPNLDSIKDELLIYNNVVTPATQTLIAMRQILTFSNYEDPNAYKKDASIIEIAHGAGYKTFWFDNQGEDDIDNYAPNSYRPIAKMCNEYHANKEYLQDESLIPYLKKAIKDTAFNKLIFIHLNGSHFPYNIRYPNSFDKFKTQEDIPSKFLKKMNNDEISTYNAYDNSILYNDFVLSKFINELKPLDGAAFLLYISDHGEEVFDSQHYSGRSFDNISQSMCRIPFILWRNEKYRSLNNLDIDTNKVYSSDDIIHSIMDLIGVSHMQKDTCRSIFSTEFQQKRRKVNDKWFDDIK